MKTKNNVQKAILKSAAVITSLVLLSFTVNAQGSFKELLADNSFGTIARILTENPSRTGDNTVSIEKCAEPELQVEDWMLSFSDTPEITLDYQVDDEAELLLEGWMTKDGLESFSNTNEEGQINLENWMMK